MKNRKLRLFSHLSKWFSKRIHHHHKKLALELIVVGVALCIIGGSSMLLWMSTFKLPDLNAFEQRKVTQSTKIYDRTGKILLYDVHQNIKRTLVPSDQISKHIKNATVAIEDQEFYTHIGIRPIAFGRAVLANIMSLEYSQGGSTITQQVIKNSLLTAEKRLSRKIKEWVLALKLEQVYSKDQILNVYLNESPYGGNVYGVEEASQQFFGKPSSDVTIAEAAYLASLTQAPTYYSPFGNNKDKLDARKNLVLRMMLENKFISQEEYNKARAEKVTFGKLEDKGIKAPHFVFFVKEYLVNKYGEDAVQNNGYKVITTLDYELQKKAEDITKRYALENKKALDAENAALVAVDPKTGQILVMVGSRDYFDKEINGNYNVTTALRQPGSSFKPFAYTAAFMKGYLPETVVFDLKTEFSTSCTPQGEQRSPDAVCYSPGNYDDKFRGPMSLRDALAQSINVPAVKTLYLAGVRETLQLAKNMGIESLGDPNRYGLTLVLGGGEVTPLEMTSAYATFANRGIRHEETPILRIEDKNGNIVEEFTPNPTRVLDEEMALVTTDVLADNDARAPGYGTNSPLYFPNYDVAAKTGTTNDFRDAWIIGYSPTIAVGAWAGNNDNRPMLKEKTARYIIAPMWNEFMQEALKKMPKENFQKPAPIDTTTYKPILKGLWQGGKSYFVDKSTGKLATELTPYELREERVVQEIHSILHWVDKSDPLGPFPSNPMSESQYELWEHPIRQWAANGGYKDQSTSVIPTQRDDVHTAANLPKVTIINPVAGAVYPKGSLVEIALNITSKYQITHAEYYLNNVYMGASERAPFNFSFVPKDYAGVKAQNELRVVVTDSVKNKIEGRVRFGVKEQ